MRLVSTEGVCSLQRGKIREEVVREAQHDRGWDGKREKGQLESLPMPAKN